jgi:hypothetical protein
LGNWVVDGLKYFFNFFYCIYYYLYLFCNKTSSLENQGLAEECGPKAFCVHPLFTYLYVNFFSLSFNSKSHHAQLQAGMAGGHGLA